MTHLRDAAAAPVIEALQSLIEAVTFDESGANGRGGNGGLLGRDTVWLADKARFILSDYANQAAAHRDRCLDTWMLTASGRKVFPALLAERGLEDSAAGRAVLQQISIEDIAAHLSKICRFNGACNRFMSVAEHSVHVAMMVPQADAPYALLHDAAEAYLGDVTRPVKRMFPEFQPFEDQLLRVILHRFGLQTFVPATVWIADDQLLAHEIMVNCTMPDGETLMACGINPDMQLSLSTQFEYLPPDEARQFFLDAARALLPDGGV